MDFKGEIAGRIRRIVAIVTLILGLSDATRLLGISPGTDSPIALYGATGFAYLAVFCVSRLFASVGLWIHASWGAVLLVGATSFEIALYLLGSPDVEMSLPGLLVRIVLVATIVVLFVLSLRLRQVRD